MRTIAIDIRPLGKKRTGDEAVFRSLTKSLLMLDTENHYLLLTDELSPSVHAALLISLGAVGRSNVEIVPLFGRNRFIWNLLSAPWYLMSHSVDIFHTQYILPIFVPRRTKVIDHIHDVSFRAYPELIAFSDRLFLAIFLPLALRRADRLVVPSKFTRDELLKYYRVDSEKISVVPNATSEEYEVPVSLETVRTVREKLGLPEKYILSVGTLQPRKNIPTLVAAFAEFARRCPEYALVIVGNRAARHFDIRIDEEIESRGLKEKVFFPGYVRGHDLPALIRGARLFVFPSLYEGFGIPLLEAMAEEVPVLASDIPCFREVAGSGVAYFPPLDIARLAEILYTFSTVDEDRKALLQEGKAVRATFSWTKSARILLDIYNQV